jgi:putative ABC transport system ATP-binding protein
MLQVKELTVEYRQGSERIMALDRLSFSAREHEIVVVRGPSGCGKTTLLSCLGGILRPTRGSVHLNGVELTSLDRQAIRRYRREAVGFVFQSFNLVPSLNALENVTTPLLLAGVPHRQARVRAGELLEHFGLSARASHRPGALSGGEKQRVAVARALIKEPPLVLADEPTSNLDRYHATSVVELLEKLRGPGRVVIIATHDELLLPLADRTIDLGHPGSAPYSSASRALAAGLQVWRPGGHRRHVR